jgi:hypothetical protein
MNDTDQVTSIKAQFMDDKCLYDSLSQAIRLMRANNNTEKQMRPLTLLKQEYKKLCANNTKKVLSAMPLSTNLWQLDDNWHAIRYINEKADTCLKVEIMSKENASLLMRDGRYERELRRNDIDALLPAIIDEEGLDLYKQHIARKARELILEHTDAVEGFEYSIEEPYEEVAEEVIVPDDEKPVITSFHAGKRWVQRIIAVNNPHLNVKNEQQAEDYYRKHMTEINEAVLDAYGMAVKVWEDDDNITYWFDANNVMYVKGFENGVPKIITLYEEDFGFTKEINRMITLKQLEVLSGVYNSLKQAEVTAKEVNARAEADVQGINSEITALESQIALLVSQRAKVMADRDIGNKQVKVHKDRYIAESNKLFTKWDA